MPWALLGDFNNICSPSEKLGGSNSNNAFHRAISNFNKFLTMIPNYVLLNLPICRSDHGPMILTSSTPRIDTQKVFRMEAMWLSHTDFPRVVNHQLANSPTSSFLINKNSELNLNLRSLLENEEIFYA
ncbi:unnamed protein product [Prunus brigantina]